MPKEKILNLTTLEWEQLNEEMFNELFKLSAVKRTKYKGLKRNIQFITS
jgi:epoxyqueuosine reductase